MNFLSTELCSAAVAYAGAWETGAANAELWPALRRSVAAHFHLVGRAYWSLDLYEERPFTAREARDAIHRREELFINKDDLREFRERLGLVFSDAGVDWPLSPLFRNWTVAGDSGLGQKVLRFFGGANPATDLSPITREADFDAFLKMAGFERAFVRFWRIPPKNRSNHLTRALVSIAASIGFLGSFSGEEDYDALDQLLIEHYHATPQTVQDLVTLVRMFEGVRHDPTELACRLRSDATVRDLTCLIELVEPIHRIGRRPGENPSAFSDREKLFSKVVCEGLRSDN